jgi:hypothetical protein
LLACFGFYFFTGIAGNIAALFGNGLIFFKGEAEKLFGVG